jgi:hypothetical protein
MMAQTHTPGPWQINFDPEDGRPLEIATQANPDKRIAFLASNGRLPDARLICAAPKMLAALKAMLMFNNTDYDCGRDRAKALLVAKKSAWKAIAEAEGTP